MTICRGGWFFEDEIMFEKPSRKFVCNRVTCHCDSLKCQENADFDKKKKIKQWLWLKGQRYSSDSKKTETTRVPLKSITSLLLRFFSPCLFFRFTDKGQVKQSLRSSQVTPVDLNMFCCWLSEEFREFSFSGFSDQRSGLWSETSLQESLCFPS